MFLSPSTAVKVDTWIIWVVLGMVEWYILNPLMDWTATASIEVAYFIKPSIPDVEWLIYIMKHDSNIIYTIISFYSN